MGPVCQAPTPNNAKMKKSPVDQVNKNERSRERQRETNKARCCGGSREIHQNKVIV